MYANQQYIYNDSIRRVTSIQFDDSIQSKSLTQPRCVRFARHNPCQQPAALKSLIG